MEPGRDLSEHVVTLPGGGADTITVLVRRPTKVSSVTMRHMILAPAVARPTRVLRSY